MQALTPRARIGSTCRVQALMPRALIDLQGAGADAAHDELHHGRRRLLLVLLREEGRGVRSLLSVFYIRILHDTSVFSVFYIRIRV